jgi:protein-tyrosine phosphatase
MIYRAAQNKKHPRDGIEIKQVDNKTIRITRQYGRVKSTHITETVQAHMDCSRVDRGIYQGARPEQYPFFADVVVNLEDELVHSYQIEKLAAYSWNPIKDKAEAKPTIAWLDRIVDLMIKWRTAGLDILVHCKAGISRSSLITAGYIMKVHRVNCDEALFRIREHRPHAHPNLGFLELLHEYEAFLQIR